MKQVNKRPLVCVCARNGRDMHMYCRNAFLNRIRARMDCVAVKSNYLLLACDAPQQRDQALLPFYG